MIPTNLCNQLELNQSVIKPELLSKIIKGKNLPQDFISKDDGLFETLYYLGLELANGCQLLKLNNGTVEFMGSVDSNDIKREKYLYNEEYYKLIQNNSKIKKDEIFIDIKYSEMISNNFTYGALSEVSNIFQLYPIQFFFKVIYPNYDSFSLDETKSNLNFLKSCFFKDGKFSMVVSKEQYQMLKETKLIPSKYKDIVKLYPITSLYSFEFKDMFDLPYPLDCFDNDEWKTLFREFKIKDHIDHDNICNEFKRLSNQFYSLKEDEGEEKREELVNKSHYLWKNVFKTKRFSKEDDIKIYDELFNTVLELNIVPTETSNIFGSKQNVPLLGRISSCYDSKYEKLLFTVKFKSRIHIQYPEGYSQFTNEDVYENLVNILSDHNQWPKKNNQHNDTIFELLRANLQYLEDQIRGKHRINNLYQFKIVSLPIQDSNQSIPFENIIFENTNVTPFFSSLPSFYSSYPNLFKSLGVQNINNHQSIINRLNQFLHQELNQTELKSFKLLNDILSNRPHLFNENLPILTDNNFLKPKSHVFYIDYKVIYERINISGRLWPVNKMYTKDIGILSIPKLSNLVDERINLSLTKFKNNDSLEFQIFNSEFLKHRDLTTLLDQNHINSIKNRILTIQIKYGTIYVKTFLKNDDNINNNNNNNYNNSIDISKNQPTSYYYDSSSGTLYLDEKTDLYSTLEEILGFETNSLKNIFNKISANRYDTKLITKLKDLENIINSHGGDGNNSKSYFKIASEKNKIAIILHDSGKYDEVFVYCNKSISYSIKSILEYQNISYSSHIEINGLKRLSINLSDLAELSKFQTNINLFKTSLCKYSNQENSAEILELCRQYLLRAKSLIHS